jgi:hypothetical protein
MIHKLLRVLFMTTLVFAGPAWAARVSVPDGTPVSVRLKADLSSRRAEIGDRVDFAVAHAVIVGGVVVIPEGSVAWGAVQSVKRDKEIKFDVQGLRLPSLREIKLRSVRQKTSNAGRDQIRLETRSGDTVGAAVGTEFTAYLDENVDVEGVETSAAAPSAGRPAEVRPMTLTPAPIVSAPSATAPAVSTSRLAPEQTALPRASTTAQATQPQAPPLAAPQTTPPATSAVQETRAAGERITVECFSDPSGAEIFINDDYYGNTPSILKLLPTTLRVDMKMPGYKTDSRTLDLTGATGLRTVRGLLEKKE